MIRALLRSIRRIARPLHAALFPNFHKRRSELSYWKGRHSEECILSNGHYEPLFTKAFDLSRDDYTAKRVLDIGCGPRGSLEWADMALQRVGLDPLVPDYLKLGADRHRMEYVAAPSEKIPFASDHFDIVACLNALDHVDDLGRTISEIKRVIRAGGLFLLSVEIDHPAEPGVGDGHHLHPDGTWLRLSGCRARLFQPPCAVVAVVRLYPHPLHQRFDMPTADLAPLGSQQASQHPRAGERREGLFDRLHPAVSAAPRLPSLGVSRIISKRAASGRFSARRRVKSASTRGRSGTCPPLSASIAVFDS